jgi:hypothetical protein
VSPLKYELGFYIPVDDILHSHRRENLKPYMKNQVPRPYEEKRHIQVLLPERWHRPSSVTQTLLTPHLPEGCCFNCFQPFSCFRALLEFINGEYLCAVMSI